MECQRIVSHKNCSGFKNIGIPIQLFKNTKEETISYCQKMQCRIAEDQLQETNSNANYILPRGERKHLSHACSMLMSGVEPRTVRQKKLIHYLLRYNCFPCDFDACADCAAKEGEKIENLAEKNIFYEIEMRI